MADQLYRKRQGKMIGGVAAGLGEYINVDPILIRVLFVIFTIINPLTLLAYIILWIVVEEQPYQAYEMGSSNSYSSNESETESSQNVESESKETYAAEIKKPEGRGRKIAGILLIAIGFVFLADQWFPRFDFADIFPYALIAGGIWLLINATKKESK